jgi:plasmid maintenance system antidote protein VapI
MRRTIVERLGHAIVASGECIYGVGNAIGVSKLVRRRFVRSERGISLETAAKLCTYLGLNPLTRC